MYQTLLDIQNKLKKNEVWRGVDFSDVLSDNMSVATPDDNKPFELHCNIPNLDATRIETINGFCHTPLSTTSEGVVFGSLSQAKEQQPALVAKALGQTTPTNEYKQLNDQANCDGVFVYVPDNTCVAKPLQLLQIYNAGHPVIAQSRNCIYVGRNSHITLIHCDDSLNAEPCFANNVTEIVAADNATVEHYKMQNLNDATGLHNQTYIALGEGGRLLSVAITLNGGHIRNHCEVTMRGPHCDVQVHGLYLNDRSQRVDNYVYVDHAFGECHSHELFKGILDDSALGRFNGHVLVRDGATKTEAYMQNKNILLTDKAEIFTRPFLEIYNDDVKCSHGSSIGQLDDEALFYLRSRGISTHTARTLLLYAFCDEVLQTIQLDTLRQRLSDMVKKRLHGDLTVCSDCALHCTNPCGCAAQEFEIDPDKL